MSTVQWRNFGRVSTSYSVTCSADQLMFPSVALASRALSSVVNGLNVRSDSFKASHSDEQALGMQAPNLTALRPNDGSCAVR